MKLHIWDHAVHSLLHQASYLYNEHKRNTAAAAVWRKKLSLIKFAHDSTFHYHHHVRSLRLLNLRIPPSQKPQQENWDSEALRAYGKAAEDPILHPRTLHIYAPLLARPRYVWLILVLLIIKDRARCDGWAVNTTWRNQCSP